jgi:hypothetical protein
VLAGAVFGCALTIVSVNLDRCRPLKFITDHRQSHYTSDTLVFGRAGLMASIYYSANNKTKTTDYEMALRLAFCALLALLAQSALATNYPCSGKKGGVARCDGSLFVCNDGSISGSTR